MLRTIHFYVSVPYIALSESLLCVDNVPISNNSRCYPFWVAGMVASKINNLSSYLSDAWILWEIMWEKRKQKTFLSDGTRQEEFQR